MASVIACASSLVSSPASCSAVAGLIPESAWRCMVAKVDLAHGYAPERRGPSPGAWRHRDRFDRIRSMHGPQMSGAASGFENERHPCNRCGRLSNDHLLLPLDWAGALASPEAAALAFQRDQGRRPAFNPDDQTRQQMSVMLAGHGRPHQKRSNMATNVGEYYQRHGTRAFLSSSKSGPATEPATGLKPAAPGCKLPPSS